MKKTKLLLSFLLLSAAGTYAQVGVGTTNPQGVFNVDASKDNAATGAPTVAQQANDFFINAAGRVGIGVLPGTNKLLVNGSGKFTPTTTNDGAGEPVSIEMYGKAGTGTYTSVGGIKLSWYVATGGIDILRGPSDKGVGLGFSIASETNVTSEAMRISATGNVGIGTTSPTEKLDVAGNIKLSGKLMPGGNAGTTGQLLFSQGTSAAPQWISPSVTNLPTFYSVDGVLAGNRNVVMEDKTITFSTDNTKINAYNIDSGTFSLDALNDRVGIGTTSPLAKLDVQSSVKEVARFTSSQTLNNFSFISIGNDSGSWTKLASGSGAFAIRNYNTDATVFYSDLVSGNTGIGTSSPSTKLEIDSGTADDSGLKLTKLTSASVNTSTASTAALGVNASGKVVTMGTSKRVDSVATNGVVTLPVAAFGTYKVTVSGSHGNFKTFADEYLICYANTFVKITAVHLSSAYSNGTTSIATTPPNTDSFSLTPGHGIYKLTSSMVYGDQQCNLVATALTNTEIIAIKTQVLW